MALIGESGCGKSVLGLSVVSLLPPAAQSYGTILFGGRNLLDLKEKQLEKIRGREIALVPQSAGLSLNPTMVVRSQVGEADWEKRNNGYKIAGTKLLQRFGLTSAESSRYPHQLSGGMRQRALAAMGLAAKPKLLIADEPTKGVDYERMKDVIGLFRRVRESDPNMSILLVTHDLDFAAELADRVAVMYSGRLVEISRSVDFFNQPGHPYGRALLEAHPDRGLKPIPGQAPGVEQALPGCSFSPRCGKAGEKCSTVAPPLLKWESGLISCWRYA